MAIGHSLLCLLLAAGCSSAGRQSTGRSLLEVRDDTDRHIVEVTRNGAILLAYRYGPDQPRPNVYPLVGPSGNSVLGDAPADHPHHHGLFLGAECNGKNFWADKGPERIVHAGFGRLGTDGGTATIEARARWIVPQPDGAERVIVEDARTLRITPLGGGETFVNLDATLRAVEDVELPKMIHVGLPGVRVALPMSVKRPDAKPGEAAPPGGRITNSRGDVDEKQAFGKVAEWCDYSGPNGPHGEWEGIALFSHAENAGHPPAWATRDYGLFEPNRWLFTDDPAVHKLAKGETLRLRFGILVHKGDAAAGRVAERYSAFCGHGSPKAGD